VSCYVKLFGSENKRKVLHNVEHNIVHESTFAVPSVAGPASKHLGARRPLLYTQMLLLMRKEKDREREREREREKEREKEREREGGGREWKILLNTWR
jgi:hypothetical protein